MALIKCVECGKEISDKAPVCPNCGCPISSLNNTQNNAEKIKNTFNTLLHNFIEKIKTIDKKVLIAAISCFVIIMFFILLPSGVDKDKETLKDNLLSPSSLIIYEIYTNDNYSDGKRATLFYFGAENKAGGMTDDWAYVCGDKILFESNYEEAKDDGDNQGILKHSELIEAKFAVAIGHEDWKHIEP